MIAGINNPGVQRKLLLLQSPSFQEVRQVCEQFQDVNAITMNSTSVMFNKSNNSFNGQYSRRNFNSPMNYRVMDKKDEQLKYQTSNLEDKFGLCSSCGKIHRGLLCYHKNATCYKCGRIGHIQTVCTSSHSSNLCKFTTEVPNQVSNISEQFDSLSLATNVDNTEHVYENLCSDTGYYHKFIIDTGSIESLISQSDLINFYPTCIVQ